MYPFTSGRRSGSGSKPLHEDRPIAQTEPLGEITDAGVGAAVAGARGSRRSAEESPGRQGYHCARNAETHMLVGGFIGCGMVELMAEKKQK